MTTKKKPIKTMSKLRWNCARWAVMVIGVGKPKSKIYQMALEILLDYFEEEQERN
jgi:hypothetical protein